MKMILTMSKDLGLLEINTRLPLEIVINIRPLDIEAPWAIVSSARNQGNPI